MLYWDDNSIGLYSRCINGGASCESWANYMTVWLAIFFFVQNNRWYRFSTGNRIWKWKIEHISRMYNSLDRIEIIYEDLWWLNLVSSAWPSRPYKLLPCVLIVPNCQRDVFLYLYMTQMFCCCSTFLKKWFDLKWTNKQGWGGLHTQSISDQLARADID